MKKRYVFVLVAVLFFLAGMVTAISGFYRSYSALDQFCNERVGVGFAYVERWTYNPVEGDSKEVLSIVCKYPDGTYGYTETIKVYNDLYQKRK